MTSEATPLTGETYTDQDNSASGIGTESEVWVGEGENWSEKDRPQETVTVGDPSQIDQYDMPHSILIWNDNADPRTIQVNLVPLSSQKSNSFQRSFRLKPDSYAVVKIARYQSYTLKVGSSGKSIATVTKLRKDLIDCNDLSTHVAVRSDGSVDSTTFSTEMLCEMSTTVSTTDNS